MIEQERKTYREWKGRYPTKKLILHNNDCEVKDCFERYLDVLLMELSFDPDREGEVVRDEAWFDTFYVPVDVFTLGDMLQMHADERSFEALDGRVYVRLWYD